MNGTATTSRAARYLATAGWLVIVVAGMRAAESILVPLLLAIFIALLCAPPVIWLERRGFPTGISVTLVIIFVILLGVGIGAIAGTSLSEFTIALPRYQEKLDRQLAALLQFAQKMGVKVSADELLHYVDPSAAMRLGAQMLSGLGQWLSNSFLILLTVVFILFEVSTFPRKIVAISGEAEGPLGPFSKFANGIYEYLGIKTLVSLATGIVVAVWLGLLGVDFPLLWGLLAFILNYRPNLGSIIAAAPAVLLASVQFGIGRALLVALGYVAINVVFGNLVEPRWMGRRLGLSTLTIFLSLVFWGWVLGPVGMILSVPLTMIFKIVMESHDDTRWVAILIGPSGEVPAAAQTVAAAQETQKADGEGKVAPP